MENYEHPRLGRDLNAIPQAEQPERYPLGHSKGKKII